MSPDVRCLTHLAALAVLLPVSEAKQLPLKDMQPSGGICKNWLICICCPLRRYQGCPRSLNDAHAGSAIFRIYLRTTE